MGHGHIFVVDDDTDIRDILKEILEEEGYEVQTASNGEDALRALRAANSKLPCLILLDLMMPVMDGWKFRSEQVNDNHLKPIPVVVLSADGNVADKASQLNADGFLRKPVRLEHVLKTVRQYCT